MIHSPRPDSYRDKPRAMIENQNNTYLRCMKKIIPVQRSYNKGISVWKSAVGIVFFFIAAGNSFAQQVTFQKTFGGTSTEYAFSVQQTTDGGFVIAGETSSFGAGSNDIYLIKTDENGNGLWTKTFGGINYDRGSSVQQTTDGGFVIAGYTASFGAGSYDVYLIRTDSSGNGLWTKTFGGIYNDRGSSAQQTTDGGFVITGYTASFGAGSYDVYLIRTDSSGNGLWTKTFGGTNNDDWGYSVQQTTDGGFVIAGYTASFGAGSWDVYLIRTDSSGNVLWTKTFGGTDDDACISVQQTYDGGFIITGESSSFGSSAWHFYLVKTDSLGNSGCNQGNTATIVTTSATQVTTPATIVTSPATIVTNPATIVGSGGTVTTLCTTVGITPLSFGEGLGVRLSPNPASGYFAITFPNTINKCTVSIYNIIGEKILTAEITNTSRKEISLTNINPGIYIVKVSTGENIFTQKLVVE